MIVPLRPHIFRTLILLASGLALSSGVSGAPVQSGLMPVKSVQKVPSGVSFQLAHGKLRVVACTPRVIHVSYSPTGIFPRPRVPVVVGRFKPVPVRIMTSHAMVTMKTGPVQVQVNRKTGAVGFLDANGKPVLSESAGGRRMAPTVLAGPKPESAYTSNLDFNFQPDESIYGLGQHQDRQGAAGEFTSIDYRGKSVTLEQDYILNLAIPFLVSSRGYGVFWNNPSPTTVDVGAGGGAVIPSDRLYTQDGKPGGLTGQYFKGTNFDTLVTTRVDPQIDFDWTTTPPTGLPHDEYSVRWTGYIQAPRSGEYTLLASGDDGVRLWIDGREVIDNWGVHPVETNSATVHFVANSRHKIRMEYFQDRFDAIARLSWRMPTQKPIVSWSSEAADTIDYYYFYGPSIDQVISGYRETTGQVPLPPKWALGYWQSKERYTTQQEWLDVASQYRKLRLPIDNIVQDWQYWSPYPWGSHKFDPARYPDPAAGIATLHNRYHVHLMISVWAMFDPGAPTNPNANFNALNARGYLYPPDVRAPDRFYDAFNPGARALYWQQIRDELFGKGIDAWWLDASEPEVNLRALRRTPTGAGLGVRVMNAWPLMHTTAVYKGQLAAAPNKRVFILTRSGFAGQQRNGDAIWSSDITAAWPVLAHQVTVGLNMALSSIPYWTTDIGGFFENYPGGSANPAYGELFTRWFEWGAFCPIFRVHGTNTSKELWRFGPKFEPILAKYDDLRYRLMPYIYSQAWQVTSHAGTIMRPLVMDFPRDHTARENGDEFMFGPSILVCPVTKQGAASRSVYLPAGADWIDFWTGKVFRGGTTITAPAPIQTMPLYVRAGGVLPIGPLIQYTAEKPADPIELRLYPNGSGFFNLYEDEGINNDYEKGQYATIPISWNAARHTLIIGKRAGSFPGMLTHRSFRVVLVRPGHGVGLQPATTADRVIHYSGARVVAQIAGG